MPLIVNSSSGLRILPPPNLWRRKAIIKPVAAPSVHIRRPDLQVPAKPIIKASPEDDHRSIDENTALILEAIRQEANLFEDDEIRDLWLDGVQTFEQTGDIEELIKLTTYRRKVVPLDEFLFGAAYLGLKRDEIFPGVLKMLHELDSDNYIEAVLKGALGYGKTTSSNIMLARGVYKTSCMRHPQSTFGIRSGSAIVYTIQSVRLSTAKKAVFDDFGTFIKNSPYFKNIYPYNPLITSSMVFPEQRLSIMPVSSSSTSAISMNVMGGVLDELNFMHNILKSKSQNADIDGSYSQAKTIYNAISRRRRSRFAKHGKLPGILFLISSSRFPDDFTEIKARESTMCGGTDPNIYVQSSSIWDMKGRDQFMSETFRVMVGNSMVRSKILDPDEEVIGNAQVIEVPMDFHADFIKDTDGSLRDYAGITILASRPFLTKRTAIHDCFELGRAAGFINPFEKEQYDLSLGIPHPNRERLRTDIKAFRHAHVDLGHKRDACGVAIGHIAGQRLIEKYDPVNKTKNSEIKPIIAYDVILRIVPPPGGEIEFADVRSLLLMLRDTYGLPIEFVTFDGFQSIDSRQILRKAKFKTDYLSVEKPEAYRSLRDALYDNCVQLLPHQFLADELAGLEYVKSTGTGPDKVDHRANGTKDVADGVCGVANFLLSRRVAWSTHFSTVEQKPELQEPAKPDEATTTNLKRLPVVRKSVFRRNVVRR